MAYANENPGTMPDKKLLDTCVSAFETAIREIRKIENSENNEKESEPLILDKSALNAMANELVNYGWELYSRGLINGRDNFSPAEDEIADEIRVAISCIINKAVFSDSRRQRGGERG
jgi:hypothetical protein